MLPFHGAGADTGQNGHFLDGNEANVYHLTSSHNMELECILTGMD
jgi:hypothetical protein